MYIDAGTNVLTHGNKLIFIITPYYFRSLSYLKVAAIGGHELLLHLAALLSIQQHPTQTFVKISIVKGQVMPG